MGRLQKCRVCRRSHDQGKRHRYSKKHKAMLEACLKKERQKVQDMRFFLHHPGTLQATGNAMKKGYWCHICEEWIEKEGSALTIAATINHLASKAHRVQVDKFFWMHGGDAEAKVHFSISEEEHERYAAAVEEQRGVWREQDAAREEEARVVRAREDAEAERLKLEREEALKKDAVKHMRERGKADEARVKAKEEVTVKLPSWLAQDGRTEQKEDLPHPNMALRPKHLPPGRVGAAHAERWYRGEVDEANDAYWLPNFGRVFNLGTRVDSKKEFWADLLGLAYDDSNVRTELNAREKDKRKRAEAQRRAAGRPKDKGRARPRPY